MSTGWIKWDFIFFSNQKTIYKYEILLHEFFSEKVGSFYLLPPFC